MSWAAYLTVPAGAAIEYSSCNLVQGTNLVCTSLPDKSKQRQVA